eukprot:1853725-Amphidinium_carterae.1
MTSGNEGIPNNVATQPAQGAQDEFQRGSQGWEGRLQLEDARSRDHDTKRGSMDKVNFRDMAARKREDPSRAPNYTEWAMNMSLMPAATNGSLHRV